MVTIAVKSRTFSPAPAKKPQDSEKCLESPRQVIRVGSSLARGGCLSRRSIFAFCFCLTQAFHGIISMSNHEKSVWHSRAANPGPSYSPEYEPNVYTIPLQRPVGASELPEKTVPPLIYLKQILLQVPNAWLDSSTWYGQKRKYLMTGRKELLSSFQRKIYHNVATGEIYVSCLIPGKVFYRVLLHRVKANVEIIQAGFRSRRSCVDQIFVLMILIELSLEQNSPLFTVHQFLGF